MPLGGVISAIVVLGLLWQNPTPTATPRPEDASTSSPMSPRGLNGTQLHIDFRPKVDPHKIPRPSETDCPPVNQSANVRPLILLLRFVR